MSIGKWGPAGWHVLHAVGFSYPENPEIQDKENMLKFLYSFAYVLPCKKCRVHFVDLLEESIVDAQSAALQTRDALSHFLVDAHNAVNERTGKRVVSYAYVYSLYFSRRISYPVQCGIVLSLVCLLYISFTRLHTVRKTVAASKAVTRLT